MPELIVLPEADRDVDAQAAYYLNHGTPDTATRWLDRTRRTFEFVTVNPEIGVQIGSGLRAWRVERFTQHVVIYRPLTDRVEIVRVLHGASDFDSFL